MKFKSNIIKQFAKPTGNVGRFVGMLMSVKNKGRSNWTIENLNLKPSDYILEVGYGSGSTVNKVAKKISSGFVAGVDHSEIMYEQAAKKNKSFILNKKMKLERGTIWDLEYQDNYFDIIYGSNVHFFWKNPIDEFKKLYSLLKPGGRLLMVFQPRWSKSEEETKDIAQNTKIIYENANYANIQIKYKKMKPVTCISISGQK